MKNVKAFTLIEVLISLSVIAIALMTLITASSQSVTYTSRMKEKLVRHWVAKQGAAMIQLGLLSLHPNQNVTKVTKMFGQSWYWRAYASQTKGQNTQTIRITTSKRPSGPFSDPLYIYQWVDPL